jgi:acetate kinase
MIESMAPLSPALLTVNSGSSSLKFALFTGRNAPARIFSGAIADLETDHPRLTVDDGRAAMPLDAAAFKRGDLPEPLVSSVTAALSHRALAGIVHRIVHGGPVFHEAVRITATVKAALSALVPLAPNHLPEELRLIDSFGHAFPDVPQVACFDTAFHRGLPDVSRTLPVPVPVAAGIRRYGFHGLSYAFVLSELERLAGSAAARGRLILAHLGNGASLAALEDGRCFDTSMGLTPTGGLVMSSRAGDLDPGVITFLLRSGASTFSELDALLTQQSGLRAVSGTTSDMRTLLAGSATDPRARLAVEIFCYQARKWIGAFAAALSGVDTVVFTGGIGERAAEIRQRICEPLSFLGIELDAARNAGHAAIISTDTARVVVRVIATDEAMMMAREAHMLLNQGSTEGTAS